VIPGPDGTFVLDAGHRRKHAAIAAEAERVPCVLRPDVAAADDDRAGQARQIARKVAENVHRDGITTGEEATAYQAMLDLGVKPAAIARQTGQPRRRVLAGLGVARAEGLADRADAAALTLDQAAAIAAYADDPEVTATLLDAAAHGDGHLKHALSRAKQDRTRARNIAAASAALTEAGVTVIDRPAPDSPAVWVERLHHGGKPLDVEGHQHCPGHAAYATTVAAREAVLAGQRPLGRTVIDQCVSRQRVGQVTIDWAVVRAAWPVAVGAGFPGSWDRRVRARRHGHARSEADQGHCSTMGFGLATSGNRPLSRTPLRGRPRRG